VSEGSVDKGQQAARCCEVEVHDAVDPGVMFLIDSGLAVYRVALSCFEVVCVGLRSDCQCLGYRLID
jgi:hypothetical protein